MLEKLKKIFTKRPLVIDSEPIKNYDLIIKLTDLAHYSNLNVLFFSPVNKLYLLNTYTMSFLDLLENFYTPNLQRTLIAINIHSYFNNSTVNLKDDLNKLIKHLHNNKIHPQIEHDLYEIYNTFLELVEMEKSHV